MKKIFTVSLFGHKELSDAFSVEKRLEEIVYELIVSKELVDFLVGRSGEFDILAASVIRREQRLTDRANSSLILVLPYLTAEYSDNAAAYADYYDETELCEKSAKAHFKAAIQVRNRSMVDRSDLVVCCIERFGGGAYQTVKYAEQRGKVIFNLADKCENCVKIY